MDIRSSIASRNYEALRPATEPAPGTPDIGNSARRVAEDFVSVLEQGETTALQAMTGQADPHSLVQALAQAELAVETAVTVRDKVVEAYQEILRMPV